MSKYKKFLGVSLTNAVKIYTSKRVSDCWKKSIPKWKDIIYSWKTFVYLHTRKILFFIISWWQKQNDRSWRLIHKKEGSCHFKTKGSPSLETLVSNWETVALGTYEALLKYCRVESYWVLGRLSEQPCWDQGPFPICFVLVNPLQKKRIYLESFLINNRRKVCLL